MSSLEDLTAVIKTAIDERVAKEARARRGRIINGRFETGANSYPCVPAVDVDTSEGRRVWAQLSPNGSAVVVGN